MEKTPSKVWHTVLEVAALVFILYMFSITGQTMGNRNLNYSHGLMADLQMLSANICMYFNRKITNTDLMAPVHRIVTATWAGLFFTQSSIEAWIVVRSLT